jgi:hypothetical protein
MKLHSKTKRLLWALTVAGAAVSGGSAAVSAPSDAQSKAVRTLEAITIEGEIAVPQVLFITARDVRRYRDGLDVEYRKTALQVVRPSGLPTRLRAVAQQRHDKEEAK